MTDHRTDPRSSPGLNRWEQVRRIAIWEFGRFVKWRQQLIGIVVMIVVGAASGGLTRMVKNARGKEVRVAVVNATQLGFALPAVDGVRWVPDVYPTEEAARAAVSLDSVGGALFVRSGTSGDILVRKRAAWTGSVEQALSAARRTAQFAGLPVPESSKQQLMAPFTVQVSTVTLQNGGTDASTRLIAGGILMFGILVLFNGFASLFAGITGEKQQRITEQVIAIVSPQTWMDGKILGLAGAAVTGTLLFAATGLGLLTVLPKVLGTSGVSLPPVPGDLAPLLLVALVTLLGIVMWFAFMAAIAATIDDPNSSPRSALLLIPVLPLGLAFTLIARPETPIAQLLSVFPLTSMAVLPVRLLLTSVPWWEPVLAVVLLAAATWAFRRAAGTIFAVGILMHGKEPSWAETWRWVRSAE